ncbi:S-protein homolog 2 [Ricinus communis]|uniref:S-protein homolog n=1 Tax=Ricinus communis TaxID=3988 RepID=B9RWR1_RICCO|nr:S-protein homolog 2 [Ricinus communis]EEF44313.1 conserved hypothetical protein [Ricinus communis]|eukprot:XP_002518180.1 S-protein homolog 2 [Ricinus communis]
MAPTMTIFCLIFLLSTTVDLHPVGAWRPTLMEIDRFCLAYIVHVMNGLSNNNHPLLLQCHSRDDDLGNHTLYIGGDFHFGFGIKIFGKHTLFNCGMEWGNKHHNFDVFNQDVHASICCTHHGRSCFWRAQDDGIYFSTDNEEWAKTFPWIE